MKKYLLFFLLSSFYYTNINAAEIQPCQTDKCVEYFQKYKKYGNSGYADALATLGEFYFHGYGTDVNLELALKSYRRAAKYGSTHAQYKAGLMLLEMEQFKDVDKGISYLKKAARNNHSAAGFLLGIILSDGEYTQTDFEESDRWFTKAYQQHNAIVNRQISKMRFNSELYPDLTAAMKEYNEAQIQHESGEKLALANTDTDKTTVNWREDDGTEIITVGPTALLDVLDDQIIGFQTTNPQRFAVTTGTKLIGRSCEQSQQCGAVSKSEMKIYIDNHNAVGIAKE